MQLFNKISWYFLKEWKQYLGSIILLIIIAILQLIPPKIVGILIDNIIIKKKYENLLFYWIGLIFLISLIIYFLRYIWRILLFGAAYKLAMILRIKIYQYLSKKNKTFYLQYRTGDLMARATNDIDKVVFAAGEGVLTLIDSMITGMLVLTIMITQINWKLTFLSLLPMPIMTFIITKYGKKLFFAFQKSQKTFSNLNNQTQESLTNIYTIKGFGLENYEINKFKKITDDVNKKNIIVSKIDAKFDPIIYSSIAFSNVLTISSGSYFIWNNYITIGQLTSFMMYLGLMVWPMLALAWMFNIVERGSAAWNRIQIILQKDLFIQSGSKNIINDQKNIIIKIKKFKYPQTNSYVLKDIFIKMNFNQIIGICGPTGSGKSTLLNLIQKNFHINKGNIFYDNTPINKYNTLQWRKKISFVHQFTFLFSDTIKNNINLGNIKNANKKIKYISKLTKIHNDIMKFPDNYKTKIGEQGIMLSGGQKKRIAIARSLLLNSEILILDNALSAIDRPTQYSILKNIKKWKKNNHTIIISTHELGILKELDNIFIIQNGTIKNQGTHYELMKYENWYSKMYKIQKLNKII
ncbi:ABC transporter transmembrane domain-containing protein [Buchnera aphidicola]|uniref:Multidrug resistance-like ATP-binding protein MdlA n=1 Tax=Buchnera aphidicola (Therioaphis trifolii) TaxID=1241884 RepID=A0A4D6YN37_9GAMM|nr:ABC transporter transmembrane domain-containing protein [Buchnera aphidicola]QCI27298.1 ATP-binding cassette domain-containing protein [Buchnera aphidicola (Therioaphis trifolii)]